MRMIQELGMMYPTENSKKKKRFAIYSCDKCNNEYKMQVQDAKRCGDVCNSCTKKTHGMTNSKNYKRWTAMKTRCRNINSSAYVNYGGRGIYISDEFLNHFEKYSYYIDNLENAHKDGYTIDRIDNDRGYERGNLKWSSNREQGLNRRKSEYVGVRKSGSRFRYARTIDGKYVSFGTYDTIDEAKDVGFYRYKSYIKQANKDVIDAEVDNG